MAAPRVGDRGARAPSPPRAVTRTLSCGAMERGRGGAAVAVRAERRLAAEGGGWFRIWEFPPTVALSGRARGRLGVEWKPVSC